jgi:hypothetical protein
MVAHGGGRLDAETAQSENETAKKKRGQQHFRPVGVGGTARALSPALASIAGDVGL